MKLTVGDIRKAIEGLPDDAPVYPDWAPGCIPNDNDPGVEIRGCRSQYTDLHDRPCLEILVSLFHPDDQECETCGEHGEDCVCDYEGDDGDAVLPHTY